MKIFISGASGFLGRSVSAELAAGGHQVTGLVRNSEKAALVASAGAQPIIGDLARPDSYRAAASEHDGIIHAGFEGSARGVAVDRLAIETLTAAGREAAARGRPAFLIYTSGIWVLGEPGA